METMIISIIIGITIMLIHTVTSDTGHGTELLSVNIEKLSAQMIYKICCMATTQNERLVSWLYVFQKSVTSDKWCCTYQSLHEWPNNKLRLRGRVGNNAYLRVWCGKVSWELLQGNVQLRHNCQQKIFLGPRIVYAGNSSSKLWSWQRAHGECSLRHRRPLYCSQDYTDYRLGLD